MRIDGSLKVDGEPQVRDNGPSVTAAPPGEEWLEEHGIEQLSLLTDLETNQDQNHWSSSGLYAAANTVIVVAVVSALDLRVLENNQLRAIGVLLLSLLGAFISTTWFMIAVRSHTYEVVWIEKSFWLERKCKFPPECSIWGSKPPAGVSGWKIIRIFIATFYWIWVVVAGVSLYFLVGDISQLGLQRPLLATAMIAVFGIGGFVFYDFQIKEENKLERTKEELLRRLWPPDGKKPGMS